MQRLPPASSVPLIGIRPVNSAVRHDLPERMLVVWQRPWRGGVGGTQMIFEHTATWAAVLGAIAYGTGDFLGGCASRRLNTFSAVAIAQGVAVAFLLQDYAFAQRPLPAGALGWVSVTAGIAYAIGVISIYEGLAHGRIAIVASICGLLSILVPLAGDLVLGRNISHNEFIGMVLCAAATLLIVRASRVFRPPIDRLVGPRRSHQRDRVRRRRPWARNDAARIGARRPVHGAMRRGHDRRRSCPGPRLVAVIEIRGSELVCATRRADGCHGRVCPDQDTETIHPLSSRA